MAPVKGGERLDVGASFTCRLALYVFGHTSAPQVEVLRELFPSLDPPHLVEGAPMLLALSESTLRAKSKAWRDVLETRIEQPWEQVSPFLFMLLFARIMHVGDSRKTALPTVFTKVLRTVQ